MKCNDIRNRYTYTFYLFILSYMANLAATSTTTTPVISPTATKPVAAAQPVNKGIERSPNAVRIRSNSMTIVNNTSTPVMLIIERTPVPNQSKKAEYEVMDNLQPQGTYKLDYEYVAGGDKKQQQVTGIYIFNGDAKSHNIPLNKVAQDRIPSNHTKIGIPERANYLIKTADNKKASTYELYAKENQQASPLYHRYFKVEGTPPMCSISREVGLVVQVTPSH